ncbi:MAG: MFS transporter [candidate division Zixibacteria bacterium]|nr:MFS transporter [candidate division Zixibacteria bacterium]
MVDAMPIQHTRAFRIRRVINWFPLGLAYAFLYMGRYNLTVSKVALGDLMTKEMFGIIFAAGTITYAIAFLINGPLTDKIGGKRAMLIGLTGSAIMNAMMGIMTYGIRQSGWEVNLTLAFSIIYSVNMYFQSYGAVAIVKVNASWFHVRERGVFGGIFGILISLGIYFAFDWGTMIVEATKVSPSTDINFIQSYLRSMTGATTANVDQTWWVFFIPAMILAVMAIIEIFILKDKPSGAGFEDFDTADASSGEEDKPFSVFDLIKKIVSNKIILTIAFIEFCTGVLRNGIMHWYPIFAKEELLLASDHYMRANWGLFLMLAGVLGGLTAGFLSDKVFGSRRGPVAGLLYAGMFVGSLFMYFTLDADPIWLGMIVIFMSFCVIGTHGMLSGTSTMDFGGRKAAATAVGLIDGFVYLGTGFQSIALGYLTTANWGYWPPFLIPFTIIGFLLARTIWKSMPKGKSK